MGVSEYLLKRDMMLSKLKHSLDRAEFSESLKAGHELNLRARQQDDSLIRDSRIPSHERARSDA